MPACSAFGCTNRPGKKIPGISFHRFPRDILLRRKWIIACRRENWTPSPVSTLCSDHFSDDLFQNTNLTRVHLKENAVPNIFEFSPVCPQKRTSTNEKASCHVCSKSFSYKKNLYEHLRTKHLIVPEVPGKLSCSLLCGNIFRTHEQLRSHLENFHHITLEQETFECLNVQAFETWKANLESTTGHGYNIRCSEKVLKTREGRTLYFCHRSGLYRSKSEGKRRLKKGGSNKIGTICPSVIEVTRGVSDGKVKVKFWKTHVGHEVDPEHAPIHIAKKSKKSDAINFDVCTIIYYTSCENHELSVSPKAYTSVCGKPIICFTVEAFLRLPFVKKVVVVTALEDMEMILKVLQTSCRIEGDKLLVTEAPNFKHHSIKSGLEALKICSDVSADVVIIHDGFQPFFPEESVCKLVLSAKEHSAAGIIRPFNSTLVKMNGDNFLDSCLMPEEMKCFEALQAFQFDLLCKVYEQCLHELLKNETECFKLILDCFGVKAKLIPFTAHMQKIIYREDLYSAAATAKSNSSVAIVQNSLAPDFIPILKATLKKTFSSAQIVTKFNESSLKEFSNHVIMYDSQNPYVAIHNVDALSNARIFSDQKSIVNVFFNGLDTSVNFREFQKQARNSAKCLKPLNILVFYVTAESMETTDASESLAELIQSLLFDCNVHITGNVFIA